MRSTKSGMRQRAMSRITGGPGPQASSADVRNSLSSSGIDTEVTVEDVRNSSAKIDEASGSDPSFKLVRRTMIPHDVNFQLAFIS